MATLLIFTLAPDAEQRRRRLLPSAYGDVERGLHRFCLDRAVAAGLELGWRISVSSPASLALPPSVGHRAQGAGSFGERLSRSIALEQESGPLVVVGTDCPGLGPRHLSQAESALAEDPARVVVGPSPDGGFYLLAGARPLTSLLASVAWRSRRARSSLLAACRQAGRPVYFLEPLADLDRPRDLERFLALRTWLGSSWSLLATALDRILASLRAPSVAARLGRPCLTPTGAHRGRAPPDPSRV